MDMTLLKAVLTFVCCFALTDLAIAREMQNRSPTVVLGKTVFGITLGQPVTLPPCPVKPFDATSYALDVETWSKYKKTCYWSPELGATLPKLQGYVLVVYSFDEQPVLPGLPANALMLINLTINQGNATTMDIITHGVSDQDLIASVSSVLGPAGGVSVPSESTQNPSLAYASAWWSTRDVSVTYLRSLSNESGASLLFTDKASSRLHLPLVNSNRPNNTAVQDAVNAVRAEVQARGQGGPATRPQVPAPPAPPSPPVGYSGN
jgi:hypothetical protein